MKRTVILIFILVCTGIIMSPKLLNLEAVKQELGRRISEKTGWELETDRFEFRWLPLPYFVFKDTAITKRGINLFLPEIRISPLWSSIRNGRFEIGTITFFSPELTITDLDINTDQSAKTLSIGSIRIKNGRIILPAEILASGTNKSPPVELSGINGTANLNPKEIEFRLSGYSSVSERFAIGGRVSLPSRLYNVHYELSGLKIHKLIPPILEDRLVPFRSLLSLRGDIGGKGFERFVLNASGDFPCFAVKPAPDKLFIDCGTADFQINKNLEGIMIDIKHLQLKNPGVVLSGKIGRFVENKSNSTAENDNPVWLVDLKGRDIDLTAVRQAVLTLWKDNIVAKTVCSIVLGGKAKTASYYYKGPLEGFHDIRNMTIKALAEDAQIFPPETNLQLTEANGPIEISDGLLRGSGLSASLDRSYGKNGDLLLDLTGRDNRFKLVLDIDADLSALPGVLIDLVQNERFRNETSLFQNPKGRARGHLEIGDSLDDIKVNVQVASLNVKTSNKHIPWPIHLMSGQLSVTPQDIEWKNVKGRLGPHQLDKFSGMVNWEKELAFVISDLDSTIDSESFLNGLKQAGVEPEVFSNILNSVEGPFRFKEVKGEGLYSDPTSWQYSLELTSTGSRWSSNLLPYPVFAEKLNLEITQKSIRIGNSKLWMREQPILVEGELKHGGFSNWQGGLKFNGTVRETMADWLKTKRLFPEKYFPRIPCTLDDFKIDWNDQDVSVKGTIIAGMGEKDSPSARIDLVNSRETLLINNLVFSSRGEIGKLNLDINKDVLKDFKLSWQGFVSAETITRLLPVNILRAEHLEGDFILRLPFRRGNLPFSGWLNTTGYIRSDDGHAPGFTVQKLKISTSSDGTIHIKPSQFSSHGNDIEIAGTVDLKDEKLNLDLDVNAKRINKEALTKVLQTVEGSFNSPPSAEGKELSASLDVTGKINFEVEHFESSNPNLKADREQLGNGYVFSPLKGFVTLYPDNKYSLDLRSSNVCGLGISGSYFSSPSIGENTFNIYTDSASPPLLQNTLPCFGIKQDLVEGTLHVDVNVVGKEGRWTDGTANIYSEKGYIRRLGFLSKAFRIINVTDLLRKDTLPDASGKGFNYSRFDIKSHVTDNILIIDSGILKGTGLNLFTRGQYDLGSHKADLILMVAPLKSIDAIVTNIPLIGKVAGGADKALISIPVAIKGELRDPDVTLLPPGAIGQGFVNLIANTLTLPFTIFTPESATTGP